MKRLFTFTMLCMLALITVNAQTNPSTGKKLTKANVTGFVKDSEDGEALVRATIQIMTPDTAHLAFGGVTNNMGGYTIKNVTEGDYVVKISYLGYHDFYRAITVKNKATIHNVGTVLLTPNSIMLADAVVTGKLPQMEVKEDTIVFNADAFKTPEGSVLEDLIKKLPGAQVDNNGDITINGKKISKILVGGKEFFGNDKQMSMKNLPTEIIDRISTYDKASDQERLTGIQDGQEETVIDLTIKKGMQKGWFGNISAGVGTEEQFANRIMINRFQDNAQASIIGNLNSNGGGGMGMGRGASGKSLQGSVGANIVVSKDDKYEIGGNLRYNSSNRKNNNRSASERYVTTDAHTFSDQLSKNENFSDQGNAEFKIEVQVDSFTTMLIRPVVGLGNSGSNSTGLSATYNADPYLFNQITNPLNQWDTVEALMDTAIVNHGTSANKNRSDSKNASANFTLSHRYKNKKQRNLSINGSFNYTKNDGPSFNASNTKYYQVRSLMPNDTIYRYRTSPNHNTSFGLGATFSEPIATNLILQFTYNFQHSNRKSDNDTYDMGSANKAGLPMPTAVQHAAMVDSLASLLGYLPDNYFDYYDSDLSNYNRDINDNHNINLQLRWNSSFITSSIGVQFQPQRQHLEMKYMGKDIDTTRTFLRVSPTINFRYRFNRQNQLNFTYRGNMQQPSITDMIDMTDDSNPLNIRKGNPSLKPSFSNNFNIGWNDYITATMQTLFANFSFSNTMNSISSRTTYYKETGKSITQPENINGNWNINGSFGFNTPLFANERFMLNSSINTGYNNNVSFLHQLKKGSFSEYEDFKNTTNNLTLGGNLSITYRTEFWDIRANGRINYRHQDNKYLEVTSPNTYDFSYGIEGNGNWDNGWGCATNFSISSRRGYASSDANTNEAVWNAQVSYRFLKGRAATVSLQAFDILNQRSNFSRAISANGRSDTWTESINNYYMLTFQYRFNFFGSASGRRELRAQRRGMGGGMMGGGVPMF
ncbi:MAG: outer membrane beta-barrel protein [Bacteroidaceae bacterium]|nr:outer membrane beta-barrel protein [Bacteroidaceae bacterium]